MKETIWVVLSNDTTKQEHSKQYPHQLIYENCRLESKYNNVVVDNVRQVISCLGGEELSIYKIKVISDSEEYKFKLRVLISSKTIDDVYLNSGYAKFVDGVLFKQSQTNVCPQLAPVCDGNRIRQCQYLFSGTNIKHAPWWLFCGWNNCTSYDKIFSESGLEIIDEQLFKNNHNIEHAHGCFQNCKSLKSIPNVFSGCVNLQSCKSCFMGTGILHVPSKVLKNCFQLKDCHNLFMNCKSCISIGKLLFRWTLTLNDVNGCFKNMYMLQYIPSDMFKNNLNLENVDNCFKGCYSVQIIPENLFKGLIKLQYVDHTFKNCVNIRDVPDSLFTDCVSLHYVDGLFMGCEKIKKVPHNLFTNNDLKTANSLFEGCSRLVLIPDILFKDKHNLVQLNYCFRKCNIHDIPSDLLQNCGRLESVCGMFDENESLMDIPQNLFKSCVNLVNVSYLFANCLSLTYIPTLLFDKCTGIISLNGCFLNCTSLIEVPSELIINIKKLCSLKDCFNGCVNLETCQLLYLSANEIDIVNVWRSDSKFIGCGDGCFRKCEKIIRNIPYIPSLWVMGRE
jgi:hypothetical protein